MTLRIRTSRRAGFTLVELMVAAAVSVIIMAVLSTVFQSGIDTMRDMRSVGNLQDQLRAATEMIRRDLQADHFVPRDREPSTRKLISGPRLSDQWLTDASWTPPVGGYFHIESTSAGASTSNDADSLTFTTSLTTHGVLQFTSILPGDKPQNLYAANVSGTTYSSPAAEISYFVDTTLAPNHRLIRRQRLVAKTELDRNTLSAANDSDVVAIGTVPPATTPQPLTLSEISDTSRRMPRSPLTSGRAGDDVLLSNVRMFEVKVNWDNATSVTGGRAFGSNTDFPFDFLDQGAGGNTFDTGYGTNAATALPGTSPTSRIRVKAVQIRIRIHDPQNQTTRQVTIVQDL